MRVEEAFEDWPSSWSLVLSSAVEEVYEKLLASVKLMWKILGLPFHALPDALRQFVKDISDGFIQFFNRLQSNHQIAEADISEYECLDAKDMSVCMIMPLAVGDLRRSCPNIGSAFLSKTYQRVFETEIEDMVNLTKKEDLMKLDDFPKKKAALIVVGQKMLYCMEWPGFYCRDTNVKHPYHKSDIYSTIQFQMEVLFGVEMPQWLKWNAC